MNPPSRPLYRSGNSKIPTAPTSLPALLISYWWYRRLMPQSKCTLWLLAPRLMVSSLRLGTAQTSTSPLQNIWEVSTSYSPPNRKNSSGKIARKPKPMGKASKWQRRDADSPLQSRLNAWSRPWHLIKVRSVVSLPRTKRWWRPSWPQASMSLILILLWERRRRRTTARRCLTSRIPTLPWPIRNGNFEGPGSPRETLVTCLATRLQLNQFAQYSQLVVLVRNVSDMSGGWGHVLKSQGQNQMASHIFCRICSVMCQQHVLWVSHMSYTLKRQKKENTNQPNLPNLRLAD